MKYFLIFLIITLTSKCWGIPAKSAKQVNENLKEFLDPLDFQLADAIRSLDMATVALKNDPTYVHLEKMWQDSIKNIEEKGKYVTKPENSENFFNPGYDIEYDTSRIILKHKNTRPNTVHIYKRMINPETMFEHILNEPYTLSGKVENFKQKDRLVAKPENLMNIQKEHEKLMQEEQERRSQQQENMPQEKMIAKVPFEKHCEIKCDNKKIPVCAENVQNKFTIFENECDLKISNCLNPGLNWQPLPMQECKNSLYGVYKKLEKFFTQNHD